MVGAFFTFSIAILTHRANKRKKELYSEILDSECKSMDVKSDAQIERFS